MKTCIHIGGYSIDNNGLTVNQITSAVSAVAQAFPDLEYIAIGTYLDYSTDIGRWAKAIHDNGKKMWLRSAGKNYWLGTNSVAVNNATTALADHRTDIQNFILSSPTIFQAGDILSPVPDEPENWGGWNATLGGLGGDPGKAVFNSFAVGSIQDCNKALASISAPSVYTSYIATSPSASKDVFYTSTASLHFTSLLIDSYPENFGGKNLDNPSEIMQSMIDQINNWVVNAHGGNFPYHINTGISIYTSLSADTQAMAFRYNQWGIQHQVPNLDGITYWLMGTTDNASARLFDYSAGDWTPRSACTILNRYTSAFRYGGSQEPFFRVPLFETPRTAHGGTRTLR